MNKKDMNTAIAITMLDLIMSLIDETSDDIKIFLQTKQGHELMLWYITQKFMYGHISEKDIRVKVEEKINEFLEEQ